jgi:hypothetical protein
LTHALMPLHMMNANISTSSTRTFHLLHCPCNLVAIEIVFTSKLVPFSKLVWLCKTPQKLAWKSFLNANLLRSCDVTLCLQSTWDKTMHSMCASKKMLMNMRFFHSWQQGFIGFLH